MGTMRANPHRSQAIAAPRGENRTHAGPRHIGQVVGIFMASVRASRDPYAIAVTYAATVRRFDMPPVQPAVGAFECWVFSTAREKNTRPQHVGGCHRYAHGHGVTCQGYLSRLTCRPVHRFAVAPPIKGGIVYVTGRPYARARSLQGGNKILPPPSVSPFLWTAKTANTRPARVSTWRYLMPPARVQFTGPWCRGVEMFKARARPSGTRAQGRSKKVSLRRSL